MTNTNFTVRPLHAMPYAQAKVHEMPTHTVLQSYNTYVAGIITDPDGERWVYCNGLFSATTRKHIGAFAKELGLDYGLFKNLANDHLLYSLDNGNLVTVDEWNAEHISVSRG